MSQAMMPHVDTGSYEQYTETVAMAEQAVLGGMMNAGAAMADAITHVRPADFYLPKHQAVASALIDLYTDDSPTDPVALSVELERRGELSRVGGAPYLHTLFERAALPGAMAHHAQIVADRAAMRRLAEAGQRITQQGQNGTDPAAALAHARAALDDATADRATGGTLLTGELIEDTFAAITEFQSGARQRGVKTGLTDLDAATNGLHPGQMVVVAARPGMGKSVLGLQFARSCALREGKSCLLFSLEMSQVEIMMRLAAAESRVRLSDIRARNGLTDADWDRLSRAMSSVADAPLMINGEPNATVAEIRATALREHQRHGGLGLIVVDYMQLMGSGTRTDNRQQEVSEFSRQLKLLAKELDVPVVAISQLNRGPEQRTDKRPLLSDLRESGSIEQDADVVLLIHRPDAADADDPRAGEADLILAKHREGPTSTISVAHQLHLSTFADLATE